MSARIGWRVVTGRMPERSVAHYFVWADREHMKSLCTGRRPQAAHTDAMRPDDRLCSRCLNVRLEDLLAPHAV